MPRRTIRSQTRRRQCLASCIMGQTPFSRRSRDRIGVDPAPVARPSMAGSPLSRFAQQNFGNAGLRSCRVELRQARQPYHHALPASPSQVLPDLGFTIAERLSALLKHPYEAALPSGGWLNWVLGNHDRPRIGTFEKMRHCASPIGQGTRVPSIRLAAPGGSIIFPKLAHEIPAMVAIIGSELNCGNAATATAQPPWPAGVAGSGTVCRAFRVPLTTAWAEPRL
jgi:hypothetical protein